MGRRSGVFSVFLLGVSLTLLVGCTAVESPNDRSTIPSELDISVFSDVTAVLDSSVESIVFPIDAYFVDPTALGRITQANALLVDACMKEKGRSYPPAQYDLSSASKIPDTAYGIWSVEAAAKFGYELDPALTESIEAANKALIAASQSDPDWENAYASCLETTESIPLPGRDYQADDVIELTALPTSIRADAKVLASKNPLWNAARLEWSECLVSNGLNLQEEVESPWSPEVPEDKEGNIRTAVIDTTCKQQTGLVEKLSSLEARYQTAMIEMNLTALNEVATKEKAVVDRADKVIAKYGA